MSSSFSPSTTSLRPSTTNTCCGLGDSRSFSVLRIAILFDPPLPMCSASDTVLTHWFCGGAQGLRLGRLREQAYRRRHTRARFTMLPATAFLLLLLATSAGAASMRAMRTTTGGCASPFTCVSIKDVPAPVPNPRGEIVIKVHSSSVNPRCVWMKIVDEQCGRAAVCQPPTRPATYNLPFSRHTKYAC